MKRVAASLPESAMAKARAAACEIQQFIKSLKRPSTGAFAHGGPGHEKAMISFIEGVK